MKIRTGSGFYQKQIKKENIKKVEKFFTEFPNSTRKECSESTGLSLITIRNHIKTINEMHRNAKN